MRRRDEARPSFVFKVPSPEMAQLKKVSAYLESPYRSDRDVRRPDAEPLVWMSVRQSPANLPRPKAFRDLPDRRYFFPSHQQPDRLLPRYLQRQFSRLQA